jgi:hypothetical protein
MQKFQSVVGEFANEYLALDAMTKHVIFKAQRM